MASNSWLLFLSGDSIGSPMTRLARREPPKMTIMEETQQDSGCLRLKGIAPGSNVRIVTDFFLNDVFSELHTSMHDTFF